MSEYITLTSNDSLDVYPENSMSNFRVKLSKRLDLDPSWEVALVRFSFTHSLCNFSKTEQVFLWDRIAKQVLATVHISPQRIRDINHLIRIIDTFVRAQINVGRNDRFPQVAVDQQNRVYLSSGQIGDRRVEYRFSDGLNILLGLEREGFHYLNANRTSLFVYADVVSHRVVGDVTAPLLTTIDIGNLEMVPGKQSIVKMKPREYYKICYTAIDEIEVQLLEDTGRAPRFDFGIVSLTLHFRKS